MYDSLKKGLKGLTSFLGTEVKDLDIEFACQKTDVSDEEGNISTLRGCTMAKSEALDPCSVVKSGQIDKLFKKKVKVDFCDVCNDDYCNGANHLSLNKLMIFMVPCLVIILSLFKV
ncbi:hypothetical protein C0J52_10216 [Blattella germanica]|nr:hypothetical protein C0J52_10216 [Blattella germanica]